MKVRHGSRNRITQEYQPEISLQKLRVSNTNLRRKTHSWIIRHERKNLGVEDKVKETGPSVKENIRTKNHKNKKTHSVYLSGCGSLPSKYCFLVSSVYLQVPLFIFLSQLNSISLFRWSTFSFTFFYCEQSSSKYGQTRVYTVAWRFLWDYDKECYS